MTMVEYFSFLPYGKYAFYVWLAYGVSAITIITLFLSANRNHKKALINLLSTQENNDSKTKPYASCCASSIWRVFSWLSRHQSV